MSTYTDRATRTLKLQKSDRPTVGVGIPPSLDGHEGENRIQVVNGRPRLYYRTKQGWYYVGLGKDGEDAAIPIASATTLGAIKIGSGGTISSDGTYNATAATPDANDIASGDAAVQIQTSSSTVTIGPGGSDQDVFIKGNDGGSAITALTFDMSAAGAATFNDKITAVGTSVFTNLDISGDVDVDGTLETDALTIGGTTLAETIADTIGSMVSSNTETGIDVSYQDGDNTLDFVIQTLNQDTTGNAATATVLQTARTINGVSFNGSSNITVTAAGSTLSDTVTVGKGGTGTTDIPAAGNLLIGNGTNNDYEAGALTAGSNITISNADGAITIASSDTNTNQLTTFTLTGDSGSNQTIAHGNTLDIAGGTGIVTEVGATDTVTVSPDGNLAKLAALSDPDADRLLGWDDSASGSEVQFMTAGSGLSISGTTLNVDSINNGSWSGTDLAPANGGTGTSDIPAAGNLLIGNGSNNDYEAGALGSGTGIDVTNGDGSLSIAVDVSDFMTNGSNNRVVTATGADAMNAEAGMTFDGSDFHITSSSSEKPSIIIENTHADGNAPSLKFNKNSSSPADGDEIGQITFLADDDAGNSTGYCGITAKSADVSNGSEDGQLEFHNRINDSSSARMVISGSFGFGTSPSTFFHIDDGSSTTPVFRFQNSANNYWDYGWGSSNVLEIGFNGSTKFTIDTSGNIKAVADVYAYSSSDPILKENKELIDNPLEKICKLGGYSFDWKESAKEHGDHLKGKDYGVMADEVQSLFPELVQTRDNGIRAVNYDKLVPLLIEGIKELKEELNMIKGES